MPDHAFDIESAFRTLDRWLLRWQALWRDVPFQVIAPVWVNQHPALASRLLALSDEALSHLMEDAPARSDWLAIDLPGIHADAAMWHPPQWQMSLPETPRGMDRDVPGRKWQQVRHFVSAMPPKGERLIDWCSGKGHLARMAAWQLSRPAIGLERDPTLCQAGKEIAARLPISLEFQERDVLLDASPELEADTHAMALHACGDLHRRLLEEGVERRVAALSLSPCCYHLQSGSIYHPLSEGAGLQLTREDLRLAVQETVTAPARVRRQRQQEQIYRLGFDALQRHLRGDDNYLSVPPLPKPVFDGPFDHFCRLAADRKGLELPMDLTFDDWSLTGAARYHSLRRYELVRHHFRRPLEVWLVLDRARYLQQNGYEVDVGEFCPRAITPRNLMIRAWRNDHEA